MLHNKERRGTHYVTAKKLITPRSSNLILSTITGEHPDLTQIECAKNLRLMSVPLSATKPSS